MSGHVLEGFLPWTVDFLKSHAWTKHFWDFIFPQGVSEMCPAPIYLISLGWGSLSVRWPLVSIFCMVGILGGIGMGAHLLLSQKRGSEQVSGYFLWGFTFIWYGFMCLGALFTHCIQTNYVRVFYLMDVIATGCSGISAVGGFLCVWQVIDDRLWICQIAAVSVFSVFNILAVTGTPFVCDQIYIVPTTACTLFLVYHRKTFGRKARLSELAAENWLHYGCLGATLALGSVVADRWLCLIFGSHGSFLIWVFMGCDIALFSAYKYITVSRSMPPGSSSSKAKTM